MLNHKNNVHKAQKSKSKIFITILCIFGLLFSWSCSCKNRVSDPNETPINGGNGGSAGKDDSGQIIRTNGGAVSGDYQIVVASAGDTVNTTATVKFLNATGKLTAIEDVDASANTTLTVDDFDYTGTTLTFKKDTADITKYDKNVLDKVTWSGVDTKKVKATFTLTPTSDKVDLTATTQEVEIEIKKVKAITDNTYIIDTLQNSTGYEANVEGLDNPDANTLVYDLKNSKDNAGAIEISYTLEKTDRFDKNTAKRKVIYQLNALFKTVGSSVAAEDETITPEGKDISFNVRFTFNDVDFDASGMTNPVKVILKGSDKVQFADK